MEISVVIPNYNRTEKLFRAVKSVLDQTVGVNEVIVVDDVSSDHVRQYLKSNVEPLNGVQVLYNQANVGPSESRNVGVALASSDIVAFLDSDDIWRHDKLEKQISLLMRDTSIDMVYCAQDGLELYRGKVFDRLLDGWIAPNPSTIIFKKEIYTDLGGFDAELKACEDHDYWLRFSFAGYTVDYVAEELTVFTNDAKNRLSHDYNLRVIEAKKFLNKWRGTFIAYKGHTYFNDYCSDYMLKVVLPIFRKELRSLRIKTIILIACKHFVFNKTFYLKLWSFMLKKININ